MCSRIRAVLPEGVCLQSVEQETARGEGTDFVQIWEGEEFQIWRVGLTVRIANLPCPVTVTYCREVFWRGSRCLLLSSQQTSCFCWMFDLGRASKQFSGQTYNTLFSWACSMNPLCFPGCVFFFGLVHWSAMNNSISNDDNNCVMHEDTLWVESGRLLLF